MKKSALLFFVFFLTIPIVFADITITTDQSVYNLGNKIKASASILQSNNFEGLFKLTISCDSYELEYFLTPISLEANFRTAVTVPDLVATSSMLGDCVLMGNLLTNNNQIVEEKSSNSFTVTNQLTVLPVNTKITSLPGEIIEVIGVVNEAFGNNVLKAEIEIVLDDNTYEVDAVDGKFNLTLELSDHIKSGNHTIEIEASDSKSNAGSSSIELEITPVPTYITNVLSASSISPGTTVEITSSLYDQADDLINTSFDLKLDAPNGNNVFKKVVQSNEKLSYEFSQYAEPGTYTFASTFSDLAAKSSINISTVREVKIKYENETVFVENVGNIVFEDELTFILESELKKYPITKNIKVDPGKILSIDLSKEVPLGIYDVLSPLKEGIEPISEKISEKLVDFADEITETAQESAEQAISEEGLLADDVTIHDNRPFYKKIASGLSSITSLIVGADGLLIKNPLLAPVILIIIVLLLVFRYGRKPIMRFFKGKKNDNDKEN